MDRDAGNHPGAKFNGHTHAHPRPPPGAIARRRAANIPSEAAAAAGAAGSAGAGAGAAPLGVSALSVAASPITLSGLFAPRPRFARPGRASSSQIRRPWCSRTCLCPLCPHTRQQYATAVPFVGGTRRRARCGASVLPPPAPGAAGDATAAAAPSAALAAPSAPFPLRDRLCFPAALPAERPADRAMCTLAVAPPSSNPAQASHRA